MTNHEPSPTPNLRPVPLSLDWQRAFIDWLTNLPSSRTRLTYLAAWRDFLHYRPVPLVGEHHDADLATSALDMAIEQARPAAGLIVHSDLGSEFANATFHQRAADVHIRLSMSSTGNCYDNAATKSCFATVKLEAIPEGIFASRREARAPLFDYIEVFYNRQRLHSGIDYARPVSRAA